MKRETVGAVVARAAERLKGAGVFGARREADLLLAHLLDTDRGGVVARRPDPIDTRLARLYGELVRRREHREPLQYLTGQQEFYGLELVVDPRVLIPRPETEGLVDAMLSSAPREEARVLDVGTGSGCIAIALAATRHDLMLTAVDRSAGAIEVAKENARRLGVAERIVFRVSDARQLVPDHAGGFDGLVSNPPYVSEPEWAGLEPEVRDHEPREALVPGPSGLEAYEALAPTAHALLRPGGALVLELGHRQAGPVSELIDAAGFRDVETRPDLRGVTRVLIARKRDRGSD